MRREINVRVIEELMIPRARMKTAGAMGKRVRDVDFSFIQQYIMAYYIYERVVVYIFVNL